MAGGVLVCQVVLCVDVLDRPEVYANGLGDGYALVEDVPLEPLERVIVFLALEPLVFSFRNIPTGKIISTHLL